MNVFLHWQTSVCVCVCVCNHMDYVISSMNPVSSPAQVKPLIPQLTPPLIHPQIPTEPGQTFVMLLTSFWQPTGSAGLLFPGPRTPGLQCQVANIIKSQPAARWRWEMGGVRGWREEMHPSSQAQTHYCGSLPSVLPIRAQSNILLHYSPISAPYQPRKPKGLASTAGRGNVSSAAICGDGRTYWKSKQEQEEGAEGRSPGSGQASLWPGIAAPWKEGEERGELVRCTHTHRLLYIHVSMHMGEPHAYGVRNTSQHLF